MPQPDRPSDPLPLNGWKEIAAYLGRSVRAVQRWERELGLPVHRIRTAEGQTVYAFRHEIDKWRDGVDLRRQSEEENDVPALQVEAVPPAPPLPRETSWRRPVLTLAVVGLALIAVAIAVFLAVPRAGRQIPIQFTLSGHELLAIDDSGGVVWRHDFGADVSPAPAQPNHWFALDLDDDGELEVVIAVRFAPRGQAAAAASRSDALFAFARDGNGEPLWSVTAPDALTCRTDTYSAPWRIQAMVVSAQPGRKPIWVAFNHHTWWPGLVFEVQPNGDSSLRHAQPGWVRSLAEWSTASGTYLAAGGVNNERDRPMVVLNDLSKGPAAVPTEAERFQCPGLPTEPPAAVFLFPNPETIIALGRPYGMVEYLATTGADLKASVGASGGTEIVHLAADFVVKDFSFSDPHWPAHDALQREGRIRHPPDQCPSRLEKVVRRWMPSVGWQDLKVTPTIRSAMPQDQR